MGFRDDLPLGDVLKDYEAFGGKPRQGVRVDDSRGWWEQQPGAIEAEERARRAREEASNNPTIQGFGPLLASTSMALVPCPLICWDVLGYYRTLGVHWRASKKELMTAYQALGPMPTAYQTHVFKQLLDPARRRAYDMTPLGEPFLDDHYVQQALKNNAAKEAARRSSDGDKVTAEEVLKERYRFIPDDPEGAVDSTESDGPDSLPSGSLPWPFSWFAWRSKKEETDVLAEWQTLVIQAVAEQGEVLNVAVGFVGKQPHRYLVGRVGKTQVAFINEKERPTPALASAAALALINDIKPS